MSPASSDCPQQYLRPGKQRSPGRQLQLPSRGLLRGRAPAQTGFPRKNSPAISATPPRLPHSQICGGRPSAHRLPQTPLYEYRAPAPHRFPRGRLPEPLQQRFPGRDTSVSCPPYGGQAVRLRVSSRNLHEFFAAFRFRCGPDGEGSGKPSRSSLTTLRYYRRLEVASDRPER